MTTERAKKVLAFRGVPPREAGMIDLLKAAGLEYLDGNGKKRGLTFEQAPSYQLRAAAQRMYKLALSYAPQIAQDKQKREYLQSNESRCSVEWRGKLRTWLNLDRDQASEYTTADLESMLCGE